MHRLSDVIKQLKAISNVGPTGIISASTNFSEDRMEEKGELDHYIEHWRSPRPEWC